MRRTKINKGFIISLLINMLLNLEGAIPAVILLVLHFVLGWSLIWFFTALALWIAGLALHMLIIGWATEGAMSREPKRENKNPYSASEKTYRPDKK